MKAATIRRFGDLDAIAVEDLPDPVPGPGEIVIRTRAASVSTADWRGRARVFPAGLGLVGRAFFGFTRPRNPIFGTECAGIVAATGPDVTSWREGDEVIAYMGASMGGHAQFTCLRADAAIIPRPQTLTWAESGAFSFGGATALIYLRDGAGLRAGQRILIIGASGSVGSAAVQIAIAAGATVTTLTSAANLAAMQALGAARTIDYRATDITADPARYDVIMDCVGAETFARMRPLLAPGGRFLMVAADLKQMLQAATARGDTRPVQLFAGEKRSDLEALAALATAGAYRPLIDSTFPLASAREAHARVATGRKVGNVVLVMD